MGDRWNAMVEPVSLEEWADAPLPPRAEDRLDRSIVAIENTVSSFDPLEGLLATWPRNTAGDPSDIPKAPPGVGLERNIERAEAMRDANRLAPITPGSFSPYNIGREMFGLFSDGGEMDYKRGGHNEYRDFGNFNYGVFGSAYGFSPHELHSGAGIQQIRSGNWQWEYGIPFLSGRLGDNKEDYDQIERGIAYYKNRKGP
jgi:hypothetical protein